MSRVLLVSHEELRAQMSGPSIRNWELATAVARKHQVTLAVPGSTNRSHPAFEVVTYTSDSLPDLVARHDVVQAYGFLLYHHPSLLDAAHLVIDLYGPFALEGLHTHDRSRAEQLRLMVESDRAVVADLISAGDVFLCASERQRDYWLGWMHAMGRINADTHAADPGMSSLLRIVPFGLPSQPPAAGEPRFRGVMDGIASNDFVVLWGGGIWNWFDPLTLIRAAAETRGTVPTLRVVFPATASPSERVPPMDMSRQARRLSDDLGLTGKRVFFGEGWVPYEERGSVLTEADVGVSLHRDNIETRFSFRTRVLDYLWAGLPVLTTRGDSMAELVQAEGLGDVVGFEDVQSVAQALTHLYKDAAYRVDCGQRSAKISRRFRWDAVVQPLMDYCDDPHTAPDRVTARARLGSAAEVLVDPMLAGPAEGARLVKRAVQTLRQTGPGGLAAKGRQYLRRRAVRP